MNYREYMGAVAAAGPSRWSSLHLPTPPHLLGALTRFWRGEEASARGGDLLADMSGGVSEDVFVEVDDGAMFGEVDDGTMFVEVDDENEYIGSGEGLFSPSRRTSPEADNRGKDPRSPPRGRVVVLSPRRSAAAAVSSAFDHEGAREEEVSDYEASLEAEEANSDRATSPLPRDREEDAPTFTLLDPLTYPSSASRSVYAAVLGAVTPSALVSGGEISEEEVAAFRDAVAKALSHTVTGTVGRSSSAARGAVTPTLFDALTDGSLSDMANLDLLEKGDSVMSRGALEERIRSGEEGGNYDLTLIATLLGLDLAVYHETGPGLLSRSRVVHPLDVEVDDLPPRRESRGAVHLLSARNGFRLLVEPTEGGFSALTDVPTPGSSTVAFVSEGGGDM